MRSRAVRLSIGLSLALLFAATAALAQLVTLPPSGANQKSSVIQHIGLVEVRIDYSSPDVTGPQGQDRRGQIWGQLVPYGLNNLGFGTSTAAPWRAGANENTVFTVSHDVEVQGKPLAAGTYGLHMIAEEGDWTIIFSNNSTSWGSFFYDPAEDALRVTASPEKAPFREWLAYDFVDRQQDRATAVMHWEELRVPFEITVPSSTELYVANLKNELRDSPGFSWQAWNQAATYLLQNNVEPELALEWAEASISAPFVGQANFTTLQTKAMALKALSRDEEARDVLVTAVEHPTAAAGQIHQTARVLQTQGDTETAMMLFKLNAEKNGDGWPMNVGLARAYSHEGDFEKALEYARAARADAPDPLNQGNLDSVIELLEAGKDFNLSN